MGMHIDEINQVVHLIEKSKNEVREELQGQINELEEVVNNNVDAAKQADSNVFKVILLVTGLIQIELVATAWILASRFSNFGG
jgi:CHASE3 domain sensor protein